MLWWWLAGAADPPSVAGLDGLVGGDDDDEADGDEAEGAARWRRCRAPPASANLSVIAARLRIGSLFVGSVTRFLVRQCTLAQRRYLEHGAHRTIGVLAVVLLVALR